MIRLTAPTLEQRLSEKEKAEQLAHDVKHHPGPALPTCDGVGCDNLLSEAYGTSAGRFCRACFEAEPDLREDWLENATAHVAYIRSTG